MGTGDRPEMKLLDYWRVIRRRKWLIIVAVVAAVSTALALSATQSPTYRSSALILIRSDTSGTVFDSGTVRTADPKRTVENEISVLEGDVVLQRVKEILGVTNAPAPAKGTSSATADTVSVTVESSNADTAALLANTYVQAYNDVKRDQKVESVTAASKELQKKITEMQDQIDAIDLQIGASSTDDDTGFEAQRRVLVDQQGTFKQTLDQFQVDAALGASSADIISPAVAPSQPFKPTPLRSGVLAFVVGLLLGAGAAFFVDYLDQSIKNADDLAKVRSDLPLLAVIPQVPTPDVRPIAVSKPDDLAVESYRALRTNIQFLGLERDVKVLQVTSGMPGEGKTTTAANLAVVLAQTGASVVLVDGDLRRPRVNQMFSIDGSLGLTNSLTGESIDMTMHPLNENLSVMASGRIPPNPSEMLSGRRMSAVLGELRQRFDYVIIDSAPTLAVSDAIALAQHVDGVLVVVQAGQSPIPRVRRTLAALEQVNAPVLGVVLNKARDRHDTTGYGYAYGYGGYSSVEATSR
jgi:succinoglycan biosynthesis transport protein ExoP